MSDGDCVQYCYIFVHGDSKEYIAALTGHSSLLLHPHNGQSSHGHMVVMRLVVSHGAWMTQGIGEALEMA